MLDKIKRKYNRWLYRRYRSQNNIPSILRLRPLYSPSLFFLSCSEEISEMYKRVILGVVERLEEIVNQS